MATSTPELTNYVEFSKDRKSARGNIASISYDIDIVGEAYISDNPKAPAYRLFAESPLGRRIEVGGIWEKQNQSGGTYYTLTINTGYGKLNANLSANAQHLSRGRSPGQDDRELMAIIPWD